MLFRSRELLQVNKSEIEAALPRHMTPDRMLRIALTEARKTPALLECTRASFMGAIIQAAQLGLEPGSALGHCYLVPFRNQKTNTREVQFIVGYRGMLDLAGRSERCSHVIARAVYDGDHFEYEYGLNERLVHRPGPGPAAGRLQYVYAIVFLKDGGKIFDVMDAQEIKEARDRSKSADSGPWVSDFDAMAKKSVVRRLFKFMPVSVELQMAIGLDEQADREEQDNGSIIEAEGRTLSKADLLQKSIDQAQASAQDPAPPVAKPAIVKPKAASTASTSRTDLVRAINKTASDLGLQLHEVSDCCQSMYSKSLNQLTDAEIGAFHQYLSRQFSERMGAVK